MVHNHKKPAMTDAFLGDVGAGHALARGRVIARARRSAHGPIAGAAAIVVLCAAYGALQLQQVGILFRNDPAPVVVRQAAPAEVKRAEPVARPAPAEAAAMTEALQALKLRMAAAAQASAPVEAAPAPAVAANPPPDAPPAMPASFDAPPPPSPAAPAAATAPDVASLLVLAHDLVSRGDVAGARRVAEFASSSGDGRALFALAETFDPARLAHWRVRGVKADPERARGLYAKAAQLGIDGANARAAQLADRRAK